MLERANSDVMIESDHSTGIASSERFLVMGGVSFEFSGLEVDLKFDERVAPFTMRSATPQPVHVRCHVREAEPGESRVEGRRIDVSWDGDEGRVATRGTTSRFRRTADGYDVDACAHADARSASELVSSLVAAALGDTGGLLLHAAGVEVDGRAILFIGPSGAGKTTAAALTRGGAVFTWDRAAISWHGAKPIAWAMPGGSAQSQAAGERSTLSLPLAGIYRVRQASARSRVERLSAAQTLTAIRESAFGSPSTPAAEAAILDAVIRVCQKTRTGAVHTVLGDDLAEVLRTGPTGAEGVAA